jgi:serine/threonine-protein kinase
MYVVSELLAGQTLAEALNSKASQGAVLTEPLVRKIATEVLYGLADADEAGLPHCNLTPHNVFLSPDGVRVLGLGLSGWEPDCITDSSFKLPIKAQPQYMSPEQITGRIVDTRTDIFTLGIVMFRCLTGKLPFDGTVFMDISESITRDPTPDPSAHSPTAVSPELSRIMAKAMSKDPADRYQHTHEMINDLNA